MNKKMLKIMSGAIIKVAEKAENLSNGSKWCWTYKPELPAKSMEIKK